jgi:DNA-binding CsgD family transcriptional regulator/tetratricopeptide (TPR) repeat protein
VTLDTVPLEAQAGLGRDATLKKLLGNLSEVLQGHGQMCVVTGDAGAGKSHLLRELAESARMRNCYVLFGRAHSYDRGIAYASLRDQLASAVAEDFGADRDELEELIGELDAAMLGASNIDSINENVQPPGHLVTKFLTGLGKRRPTVLVLDDAHLADAESLRALSFVARYSASLPVLTLFSARRERLHAGTSLPAAIARLVESGLAGAVDLEPLSDVETSAMLGALLGVDPDEQLVNYVYAQSRGNPLFVQEVLRSLQETQSIGTAHQKGYLIAPPGAQALSGREALLQRVFQQDSTGLALARTLSAFRRVRADQMVTLELVSGLSSTKIKSALKSLLSASIITKDDSGHIEFVHPLMAEVLYNDLTPPERRRLHSLIAASFNQGQLGESTDVLDWTMHVAEAAVPGDEFAITAILKAALLTRNTAPLSAATWFGRAIDLTPPGSSDTPLLLARQATAYWKGSRPEAAVDVGLRALDLLAEGPHRTKILATVINANYSMGRYLDALAQTNDDSLSTSTVVLAQRSQLLAHIGRTEEASRLRSRVLVEALNSPLDEQAIIYTYVGHASECLGDYHETLRAVDTLLRMCDGDLELSRAGRLSALESAAYLLARSGALFEARQVFARVTALLPETGFQDVGGQNIYTKARIEYLTGSWDEALATIRSGTLRLDFEGLKNNMAWLRLLESEILTDQALLAEASEIVNDPLLPEECVLYSVMRAVRRAKIDLSLGDFARAEGALTENLEIVRATQLAEPYRQLLETLVDLYRATDRSSMARDVAAELCAEAERSEIPLARLSANMARAALGDAAVAEQLVEQCESEGRLYLAAQAHYHLGSLGVAPGRNLFRSLELFSAIGAVHWNRRTLSRSKELGLSLAMPRDASAGPAVESSRSLTETEVQLVRLTQQGLTNRQIAAVLHYSVKTIEVYLSRLYQKVGCHSRVGLALAAERGHLLEDYD